MTSLLNKDNFLWSEEAIEAFEQLKLAVTKPSVLSLPDFNQIFVIECDACGSGVGTVLMQSHKPLTFFSQTLKGKNLQLSTYEKDLLTLVITVKKNGDLICLGGHLLYILTITI